MQWTIGAQNGLLGPIETITAGEIFVQYRREIDGLRALAVLPVMLFHAGLDGFSGGFVGVDVFFVISGYLITSIIVGEQEKGKFSLLTFYERRARRILPALFFVILCCLPFAHLWMNPSQHLEFSRSIVAVMAFASNFLFWRESGYFAAAAEEKPLLHTWSLAVEEQYYVIFPLMIMLLWPLTVKWGRKWLVIILAIIAVASLAVAQWASVWSPTANFYLAPSRAWELLGGGFCALYLQTRATPLKNQMLPLAGIGLICYAIFAFDADTPFPSLWALVPVGGTMLIILFATHETLAGRFLAWRGFVGVGLISYSAYLWHQPLYAFARLRTVHAPTEVTYMMLAIVALALAYFSWRFVESPFRNKQQTSRKQIAAFSIAGMMAFAATGAYGAYKDGYHDNFVEQLTADQAYAYTLIETAKTSRALNLSDDGACQFGTDKLTPAFAQRLSACFAQYGPALVIVGDSHGRDVYQALVENVSGQFIVGLVSGGCRPQNTGPRCTYYHDFTRWLAQNPQMVGHIIYHSAGLRMLRDENYEAVTRTVFHHRSELLYPAEQRIQKPLDYMTTLAQYAPVTWLGPRLEPHNSVKQLLETATLNANAAQTGTAAIIPLIQPNVTQTFINLDAYIVDLIAKSGNKVGYISYINAVPFDPATSYSNCCAVYWADTDHWSKEGRKYFGDRLKRALGAK